VLASYWLPVVCQSGFSVPGTSEAGKVPVAAAISVLVSAKSFFLTVLPGDLGEQQLQQYFHARHTA